MHNHVACVKECISQTNNCLEKKMRVGMRFGFCCYHWVEVNPTCLKVGVQVKYYTAWPLNFGQLA